MTSYSASSTNKSFKMIGMLSYINLPSFAGRRSRSTRLLKISQKKPVSDETFRGAGGGEGVVWPLRECLTNNCLIVVVFMILSFYLFTYYFGDFQHRDDIITSFQDVLS